MTQRFSVEFLPPAVEFMKTLDDKAREKIYFNIKKAQFIADNDLFKKLNADIWEFRTLYNGIAYRLFAFWDNAAKNETLVIATHGILKKNKKHHLRKLKRQNASENNI